MSQRKRTQKNTNNKKKVLGTGRRQTNDVNVRKNKQIFENAVKRKTGGEAVFSLATHVAERLQELDSLVALVRSTDPAQQLEATTKFRKMLSSEDNPPIQDVIDAGVVPVLVSFLSSFHSPQLQVPLTLSNLTFTV